MTYISTQSLGLPMRLAVLQAQSQLAQAQTEISTGVHADLGLALGARTGLSLSLKSEIDQLQSFKSTNGLVNIRLDATSNAISSMISAAQGMSTSLTSALSPGSSSSFAGAAQNALQGLISSLNMSSGGQYIFGGTKSDTSPIATYAAGSSSKQAVDSAFQSTFGTSQSSASAASISGSSMQAFLDGPFATLFNDSNWQAGWSGASSEAIKTDIAPSQTATTSVSANEAAFRQIAQAYTMVSEFTGANLSEDARTAVIVTAKKLVGTAMAGLINLSSGVGITQSTVSSATDRASAQIGVLSSSVNDLDSVDTYALSGKVTQLQTQLEASYSLTSRLSQLSLLNYLSR